MSQPLARLGLRTRPLAARVGVRAFSVSAARAYANPTPTDKYGRPDYSKGPSALDKASQLFFFTEIFRGASQSVRRGAGRGRGAEW
jgi:NADH dehydrogenase (ubiquinone) Fe-S protein 8